MTWRYTKIWGLFIHYILETVFIGVWSIPLKYLFLSSRKDKLEQVIFNKHILVYKMKVDIHNTWILYREYLNPANSNLQLMYKSVP